MRRISKQKANISNVLCYQQLWLDDSSKGLFGVKAWFQPGAPLGASGDSRGLLVGGSSRGWGAEALEGIPDPTLFLPPSLVSAGR